MARILVVDDDPDIVLLVEASLETAGHQVVTTTQPSQVVALAAEEDVDAVVLDVLMPGVSGYEVLRQLRTNGRTARLPVLLLSSASDSRQRVHGLRQGASDFVAKPFDPDELVLRVGRLVEAVDSRELEGHLESYPFWELLQSLQHGRRSGHLELQDLPEPSFLQLHLGGVRVAAFGKLEGREAALAMAQEARGRFTFRSASDEEADTAAGIEISINGLLMESAFLQDELRKLQRFVPGDHQLLHALPGTLPALPETFESIPVTATYLRILEHPDTSLSKLQGRLAVAPQKIQLSVAWLLEQGLLTTAGAPAPSPTTGEPADEMAAAIRRLLLAARLSGRGGDKVHVLLLAQGDAWARLEKLVAAAGEELAEPAWTKLHRQMQLRRGGTASLSTPGGQLSVHAQLLTEASLGRTAATLTLCTAVGLWLDEAPAVELADELIQRLDASERSQSGLLLGTDEDTLRRARERLRGSERWRLSSQAPASLSKLLSLI